MICVKGLTDEFYILLLQPKNKDALSSMKHPYLVA